MVGERKVCINFTDIQNIRMYNAQAQQAGEQYNKLEVPAPQYLTAMFSFRSSTIVDWFIDPESKDNDIIVFLQHRGEMRFSYDVALETKLTNISSVFE